MRPSEALKKRRSSTNSFSHPNRCKVFPERRWSSEEGKLLLTERLSSVSVRHLLLGPRISLGKTSSAAEGENGTETSTYSSACRSTAEAAEACRRLGQRPLPEQSCFLLPAETVDFHHNVRTAQSGLGLKPATISAEETGADRAGRPWTTQCRLPGQTQESKIPGRRERDTLELRRGGRPGSRRRESNSAPVRAPAPLHGCQRNRAEMAADIETAARYVSPCSFGRALP